MRKKNNCKDCDKLITKSSLYCQSCWQKGEKNPLWKGGFSNCLDCSIKLKAYTSKRCLSCSAKITMANKIGKAAHCWKGGISTQNKLERERFRREMQKLIFERDEYKCQICGKGGDLQVDHIASWAEFKELRFNPENCRTLCSQCHYKLTFGKGMPKGIKGWGHNLLGGGALLYH